MLISCNKLKSHIKGYESIDWIKIWDTFTIRTAEVEDVRVVGNTFKDVVIAEIRECEEHPDSDHLHILKVDIGASELIQVVCGAPNARVGIKTAYVKVGGEIDGVCIKSRLLRGVISNGMCCSGNELGISDNHDGILELPNEWKNGVDVKKYLPIDDIIVEIDNKSLTNRPDLWGHYGIAREICAITGLELLPLQFEEILNDKEDLDIVVKNNDLCLRYSGLTIDNVINNKTPLDIEIFLYYVGMRSINLIVDLTNYLMLELGQPMHAFDSRVVKNIEVGLAKDGDKYVTLDGVQRTLDSNTLMIKNGDEYFGIAGIKGGLDSGIESDTTSLFLESATFNAASIRKSAVRLGLRTDASARYEKSLDPNMTDLAIKRFVYLLRLYNPDLIVSSNLTDVYPKKLDEEVIILDKKTLNIYMGKKLSDDEVRKILESLEFKVEVFDDSYKVIVPTFRCSKDIKIKEDLIEEIARIYGLEKFLPKPLKLDVTAVEHENIFTQEYEVKNVLATKYDMNEVHSYIWYDTSFLKELGVEKYNVKLVGKDVNNILRDDMSFSLLNIVRENFKNYDKFKIFEIGTVINNNQNKRVLSIILSDDENNLENIYNEAKKIVKYIFDIFKHKDAIIKTKDAKNEYCNNAFSKGIFIEDDFVGKINILKKSYLNKIARKKAVVLIDIDFDKFVDIKINDVIAKEVSKYPVVNLDYTINLNDNKYEYLKETLKEFKNKFIKKYSLIGIYKDKCTIRFTLGSDEKTLEHKDLDKFKDSFMLYIKDKKMSIDY